MDFMLYLKAVGHLFPPPHSWKIQSWQSWQKGRIQKNRAKKVFSFIDLSSDLIGYVYSLLSSRKLAELHIAIFNDCHRHETYQYWTAHGTYWHVKVSHSWCTHGHEAWNAQALHTQFNWALLLLGIYIFSKQHHWVQSQSSKWDDLYSCNWPVNFLGC